MSSFRRVRHGDLLSLVLFCLAEQYISCAIALMVTEGNLLSMTTTKRVFASTLFFLYADDVLIFCCGTKRNVSGISNNFQRYKEFF